MLLTIIALLVVVGAGLARLGVLHRVGGRLEDLGRRRVVAQPGDEDRAQRLGRDLLAMVALEEALHPAGPRRALHRAVEARLRWVVGGTECIASAGGRDEEGGRCSHASEYSSLG